MTNLFDLSGKTALLTGGTGALGTAMAQGLLNAGAKVALLSRNPENLKSAADALGGDAGAVLLLKGDVTDARSLESARDEILEKWGKLDILVNAAGGNRPGATIGPDQTFFDLKMDDFAGVSKLNLDGTVIPSLIFGKLMTEGGGSIVNISSMAADRAITRVVGYSAAKAGIDNFTKWLAVELAKKYDGRVRVNAIAPGFFIGEQNRRLLLNEDGSLTDRGNTIIKSTPMNRFGEAEELMSTLVWLCADSSSFVTGIVVPVDGGFSAFSGV
ncbi:NAD(P)-dependent dehydrogenase (short-subunit alcohol dehydrogenase family) [Lewinella aquimaris]|uniref:NAD(P)-dependent dehydrogenase (Short-subunit alcohol dehydrogenase family) n=1 Tax=Neolewinella aquimaris TaxID=1835722 RepID=A0A840EBR7_9BACT|nr:SDR family oxidoreductase [Neolewinella aquimaris]MBB4080965.1 NAD(P)-dependent dehydrogenase (short-subunit alcohol dehydrogenase family) [Neolewinella aquimaris]